MHAITAHTCFRSTRRSHRTVHRVDENPRTSARQFRTALAGAFLLLVVPALASAADPEGFTEPYRDIDIAAAEMGIVAIVSVKEGDRVEEGQLLAELDSRVLRATLKVAESAMQAYGRVRSAKEELKLQTEMVLRLERLQTRRHASEQELNRARSQQQVAAARLQSTQEDLRIKSLEFQRVQAQLDRRKLKSPIVGVVTKILKDPGEFVSPSDPVILKVVQLNTLKVVFLVPTPAARRLNAGKEAELVIGAGSQRVRGVIEFVSPTPDPQSGTTKVLVRIPNPEEKFSSGDRCRLLLGGSSSGRSATSPPAAGARP